jgi:methyl-accepting chemotaxis protein
MDVFFQHQQLPGQPAAGGWGVGLPLNGTGELVRVEPFRDRYALDWRIVVTILGAVGVSGTLGMQAVRRVNASLTEVVEGSEALSEGNLDHEVTPGEAAETQRVAMSLNTMTPP